MAPHVGTRVGDSAGVSRIRPCRVSPISAVNIYIVRHLGAVQYGAFALAYVTYGFVLQASRGLATDPLLVRYSGKDMSTWRRAVSSAAGTATLVGLVGGGWCSSWPHFWTGRPEWPFLRSE